MNPNRLTLILNAVNPQPVLPVRTGHAQLGGARPRTYSADAICTGGGAKSVTVDFYGSNAEKPDPTVEAGWTKLGSIVLATDGTNKKADGFVSDDTWNSVKAVISACDAGDATMTVNAYASVGKGA